MYSYHNNLAITIYWLWDDNRWMVSLCNLESLVYILYLLALENRRRLERVEAVQDYAYHMYPHGYHASGLYCIRMCLCMYGS